MTKTCPCLHFVVRTWAIWSPSPFPTGHPRLRAGAGFAPEVPWARDPMASGYGARRREGGGTEALQTPLRMGTCPASALVFPALIQTFRGGYRLLVSHFLAAWLRVLRDESRSIDHRQQSGKAVLLVYKWT